MWANTLMDVLKDNGIPCVLFSVRGAGLTVKLSGFCERLRVFVPAEYKSTAEDLHKMLFSDCQ